jgi:hypothetical protein
MKNKDAAYGEAILVKNIKEEYRGRILSRNIWKNIKEEYKGRIFSSYKREEYKGGIKRKNI